MKTHAGIKGIWNDESAQEENFLISCETTQITEGFFKSLSLNTDKTNREDHY